MYQRILVPTDGSAFSERILPLASSLAADVGANLALTRVPKDDAEREKVSSELLALSEKFGAEAVVLPGTDDVAASILEEAARVEGTLVAMTTHGRTGVMEAVLGSVARQIVNAGRELVLVWRPSEGSAQVPEVSQIRTVVLPIDGSERSESMRMEAVRWTQALGARLIVVKVWPLPARTVWNSLPAKMSTKYVQQEAERRSAQIVDSAHAEMNHYANTLSLRHGIETHGNALFGDPLKQLSQLLRSQNPDNMLVVMATRGNSGRAPTVIGSVTAGVLRKGGIPTIVQRPA